MLNYEDLIGNILFNVYDKKTSGCNDDFLEMKGFKRDFGEDGDGYISYSFISENNDEGQETLHTVILETLSGDVLYTEDNEDFITGINEPRYVDDLTLEMSIITLVSNNCWSLMDVPLNIRPTMPSHNDCKRVSNDPL